ncbi:protocadherin-1-like, partial [Saccoglossus kowalevskii]|uniref:Protocadherin gamma-A4-like n=1 Tax=Saccoglossus kowalevskii TaxID=10224 RepID=A0ABM0MSF6_SACKO
MTETEEFKEECQLLPGAHFNEICCGNDDKSCCDNSKYSVNLLDCGSTSYEDRFVLGPADDNTCNLMICSTQLLDREDVDEYTFKIAASNKSDSLGNPSTNCVDLLTNEMILKINISDINDNKPYFTQTIYVKGIHDNTRYGLSILQVEGSDDDIGENARLCYSASEEADEKFSVSCIEGDVHTVQSSYTDYVGSNCTFDVTAQDTPTDTEPNLSTNNAEVI